MITAELVQRIAEHFPFRGEKGRLARIDGDPIAHTNGFVLLIGDLPTVVGVASSTPMGARQTLERYQKAERTPVTLVVTTDSESWSTKLVECHCGDGSCECACGNVHDCDECEGTGKISVRTLGKCFYDDASGTRTLVAGTYGELLQGYTVVRLKGEPGDPADPLGGIDESGVLRVVVMPMRI